MADKSKSSFSKMILNLIIVCSSAFSFFGNITSMIEMETKLAKKSLIKVVILIVVSFVLLLSSWFAVLALLFAYFDSLHIGWMLSLLIILLLNLMLLAITVLLMMQAKENVGFPGTSKLLKSLTHTDHD